MSALCYRRATRLRLTFVMCHFTFWISLSLSETLSILTGLKESIITGIYMSSNFYCYLFLIVGRFDHLTGLT